MTAQWRRFVTVGIATCLLSVMTAQEVDTPVGPEDIAYWVDNADSIVIGTFRSGWPFPWLDGWHYHSWIEIEVQVIPEGKTKPLSLDWIRPYGTSCLVCEDLRPLDGRSGIWFLRSRNGVVKIFGGARVCVGPLDLSYLEQVRTATQSRPQTSNH